MKSLTFKTLSKRSPTISVGEGSPLLVIAGPCQIESEEHLNFIATSLVENLSGLPITLVFKASFDKANRTSMKGARGVGIDRGLKALETVRNNSGLPILTDVHDPQQAATVASVVDILQTPAFLCRQTDLLYAVGETGKPVNIKKGQFLPPQDMKFVAEKVRAGGSDAVMLCERGSSFGYRDLVVDMRGLVVMKSLDYPVIFDATHSVQSLGGADGASGGNRDFVAPLVRAASAVGVDGIFIECHENPARAPSDGDSMLELSQVRKVVETACRIRNVLRLA